MPASNLSSVRVRDRATIVTSIVLLMLAAAAWGMVLSMRDQDMAMDAMAMSAFARGLVFVAGWAVMMTAMMLPSALPMIALYGAIQRRTDERGRKGVPVAIFTLVYLVVWALTGAPVYVAQEALARLPPTALSYGVAVILLAAGAFQLSPLKQACLRACRSPLGFLLGHWRAGYNGSLLLGWSHAAYCLGCCWALMLVLVAAGAMGLPWVLLIAGLVAAEKLLPGGEWIARIAGGALVLLAVTVALRPDLVATLRGGHMM